MNIKKTISLVLVVMLLITGTVIGTIAWLTHEAGPVENTFAESNIEVILDENTEEYKMIPGWAIDKDPYTYVSTDSEDCYLFVKIDEVGVQTEGAEPVSYTFDQFIKYEVDEAWTALGETYPGVYYMVIDDEAEKGSGTTQRYNILGAGSYEDADGVVYSWNDNEVLTLPEVTKDMMDFVAANGEPKLNFTAYAVQLWKTNEPVGGTAAEIAAAQFTPAEAWAKVAP